MSKMDNLRAMREARYDRATARASRASRHQQVPPVVPVAVVEPVEPEPADAERATAEQPCGHRNMSGRTCTRERGHAAKSHRYS
jgi:hypothetical protein